MLSSSLPPPRTRATDAALFARYRGGDMQARERIAQRFMPLAERIAGKYRNRGQGEDDLRQVAYLGLLKAIDRFEPELGGFERYAVPSIMGELKRHFRDTGWALHVPRRVQERLLAVNRTIEDLRSEGCRRPRPSEVAARLGVPVEEVLEALEAGESYTPLSVDAPARGDGEQGVDESPLVDRIGGTDSHYDAVETGEAIRRELCKLPREERRVVGLRVVEDLTQTEIAKRVGVSQMQVSRLLRRSGERLKRAAA